MPSVDDARGHDPAIAPPRGDTTDTIDPERAPCFDAEGTRRAPAGEPSSERRGWPRLIPVLVAAAVTVTVLVRLWQVTRPSNYLDGDEAITGLMADRIRHGHFYVFFAGQNYGGAFESYLQALVGMLPLPRTHVSLIIPQLALAGITCWLVFLVGRRLTGSPWWGCAAAFLYAVGPYFNVAKAAESDGFYLSIQLTGALAVYCALRMGEDASRLRWHFLVGVCLGLTVWLSLSGLLVTLPVLLWSLATVRSWRPVLTIAAGAVLGAAPALAWSIDNRQLAMPGAGQPPTTYLEHLYVFFRFIVEEFVGVLPRVPGAWFQPPALATAAVVIVLIVTAAVVRWRGLLAIVSLRTGGRRPVDLLLVCLLITPWLYALSPFAWFRDEPRYIFVLYPVLTWIAVLGAQTLLRYSRSPRLRPSRHASAAVAAGVAVGAVGVLWVALSVAEIRRPLARWPATDGQLARAADWMRSHGVSHGYAAYWTAMPMDYLSRGAVTMGALGVEQAKVNDIEHSVAIASDIAYVHSARPGDPYNFARLLRAHHVGYTVATVGPVQIYYHLSRQIRPPELGLVDNG